MNSRVRSTSSSRSASAAVVARVAEPSREAAPGLAAGAGSGELDAAGTAGIAPSWTVAASVAASVALSVGPDGCAARFVPGRSATVGALAVSSSPPAIADSIAERVGRSPRDSQAVAALVTPGRSGQHRRMIATDELAPRDQRRASKLSRADHGQHPVGRVGRPEDVAGLCAWPLSNEAGFVTGQNFVIDGGMTRKMIYV
jgi:hypothetical protein